MAARSAATHRIHARGGNRDDAMGRRQFVEPKLPCGNRRQRDQSQQRVVQFVGITHHRPRLRRHLFDGRRIQRAHPVRKIRQRAAHLHGTGATFLERRIIQIGIRIGVEDFVGKR